MYKHDNRALRGIVREQKNEVGYSSCGFLNFHVWPIKMAIHSSNDLHLYRSFFILYDTKSILHVFCEGSPQN